MVLAPAILDLNLVQVKSIKKQRKCIKTNKLKHEYCYITAHKTAILSQGAVDLKLIGCWWWFNILTTIKFIYSEKATKFCEISTLLLTGTTLDKSKVEISQNCVAFSEDMNFTKLYYKYI